MSEFPFPAVVSAHREDQFSGRSDNASDAADEVATKGSHLPEAPQHSTLRGRTAARGDLQFVSDVAGKDAGEHVQLVADQDSDRYVIHLAMRFQFGGDDLLGPSAFMEGNDVARVRSLVGDDDLEFASVFNGLEQVGLDRLFVLMPDPPSDGDEAMAGIP